jgi:hypothetical protein
MMHALLFDSSAPKSCASSECCCRPIPLMSELVAAPCEAPLMDASAADAASISILSTTFCNNLKKDEDLVCELSRESDPAGHQLCGA